MLPGPDLIYKCPKCKEIIKNQSLMSGNGLDMRLYSDGYQDLPMLPSFPNLTKCEKCGFFLFLRDLEPIDYYFSWREEEYNKDYSNANYTKFLDIYEYLEALKFYPEKEKFIRHMIWWKFNDRIRKYKEIYFNGEKREIFFNLKGEEVYLDENNKEILLNEHDNEIFINKNDKEIWKENCEKLIELFDIDDINERIMIADLHRNLGNFQKCLNIILSLSEDFHYLKTPFRKKCIIKDRCVFEIELEED